MCVCVEDTFRRRQQTAAAQETNGARDPVKKTVAAVTVGGGEKRYTRGVRCIQMRKHETASND